MTKKFLLLSTVSILAACSMDQQPAPVDQRGSNFYGRNSAEVSDDYYSANSNYTPPVTSSRPLSPDAYDTRQYSSGGTSDFFRDSPRVEVEVNRVDQSRPIDSNQQVFEIAGNQPSQPVQPYNTTQVRSGAYMNPVVDPNPKPLKPTDGLPPVENYSATNSQPNSLGAPVQIGKPQPMVSGPAQTTKIQPVVKDAKTEYLDLSKVGAEQTKTESKLAGIKPMPRPRSVEMQAIKEEEQQVTQETITPAAAPEPVASPKITKIETSSGEIKPDTTAEIEKTEAAEKYAAAEAQKIEQGSISSDIQKIESIAPNKAPEPTPEPKVEVAPKAEEPKAAEVKEPEPKREQLASAPADNIEKIEMAKPETSEPASGKLFVKPLEGTIVSEFGSDANGKSNDGINIQAPEGTPVKAAAGGTVVYSGNQLQGYGNLIIIRHPNGYLTAYSHLQDLDLQKGQKVGQGDVIGRVGKTGNVDTPQLHFGVRKGREPVNPKDYL